MGAPLDPPPAARGRETLFDVLAVKEALFLLLGGGLDESGKEEWLAHRLDRGVRAEYVFAEALGLIDGMVAT